MLAFFLLFTLVAAACSSSSDSTPDEGSSDSSEESQAESEDAGASDDDAMEDDAMEESESAAGGELDFLGWEGYDTFFGAADGAIADLGLTLNSTYMGAPSDIASRFASGGGDGIDILAWTSSNHAQYRSIEGTLSPITMEEVPNLSGLIDQFGEDTWDQFRDADGNWLAIPFTFAPLGITFDSSKVSPTSYEDLLAPEYTGQLGIPDVPGLHVQAASAALGYQAETLSPEELDEVIAFMQGIWGQARVLSPSFGDIIGLLASGEIVAAYGGYPGLGAFTENPDIKTIFPTEGTFSFVDVYSIPEGADNREGALAFINAMLDPANNAAINEAMAQATTVADSIALMSEANAALYPYGDLDAFFAENSVMTLPGGENGVGMGEFIEAYGTLVAG